MWFCRRDIAIGLQPPDEQMRLRSSGIIASKKAREVSGREEAARPEEAWSLRVWQRVG